MSENTSSPAIAATVGEQRTKTTLVVNDGAMHSATTMRRKAYHCFLYDLYRCAERGVSNETTKADTVINDPHLVEVFNSPDGLMVAIHHGPTCEEVTVIRPVVPSGSNMPTAQSIPAPDDFRAMHGNARDMKEAIDGTMAMFGAKRDEKGNWRKAGGPE